MKQKITIYKHVDKKGNIFWGENTYGYRPATEDECQEFYTLLFSKKLTVVDCSPFHKMYLQNKD